MAAGSFSLKYLNEKWVPKLAKMTGGELKIEILPSQAVVPHRETINAVAAGILQGDNNAVSYFTGRDQAFSLLGDLISGYDSAAQTQMFCQFGGGKEVLQKLYDKYSGGKIHVIGCGAYSHEGLVVGTPVRKVDDFKGIKIRAPEGLAAEVFKRVGATPVAIPFPEVYTALEKKIVDAADGSAYSNNDALGFHKIAKYPIFPGVHSAPVIQFIINKDMWNKLGEKNQTALEVWYHAAWVDLTRASDIEDRKLVARDKAGQGVKGIEVIDWPQAERDKFRAIAEAAWADVAKKSPLAQEAYQAHQKFLRDYGLLK
jgi:TRAP-type mannitol/chloroaromatic compound transport system substrate-binding protein